MSGEQRCEFPGCEEIILQPPAGGARQRYCSPDHRTAARRLRSIARIESGVSGHSGAARTPGPHPVWIIDPFAVPETTRPADRPVGR
jgi:hypothetical protein